MSNITVSLVQNGKTATHEVEADDVMVAVAIAALRQAQGLMNGLAGLIAGPGEVFNVVLDMFEKGKVEINFSTDFAL